MIGLDTNVLVRFLVDDDREQSARALVEKAVARGEALFVPEVVLCDLCWVLDRAYGMPRDEIVPALRALLAAKHLTFRDGDLLERALASYQDGRGGFANYVIRELSTEAGCDSVATFDRALLSRRQASCVRDQDEKREGPGASAPSSSGGPVTLRRGPRRCGFA